MHHPAIGSVKFLCRIFAKGNEGFHVVEVGLMTFGQIGCLNRPVVHLKVDVEVIVTIPSRIVVLTPFSL